MKQGLDNHTPAWGDRLGTMADAVMAGAAGAAWVDGAGEVRLVRASQWRLVGTARVFLHFAPLIRAQYLTRGELHSNLILAHFGLCL